MIPTTSLPKSFAANCRAHKVYEDDKAFAFLDIMPRAPGHTLIIPKAPARNLLDVPPADLAHVIQVVQRVAQAAKKVFAADGITLQQFNEPAGGQVVFHLHFHVVPRHDGVADETAGKFQGRQRRAGGTRGETFGGIEGTADRQRDQRHPRSARVRRPGRRQTPSRARSETPTKPTATAPSRAASGSVASGPGGVRISCEITPASTAVATALTHISSSEPSSRLREATMPSSRQNSFGRNPTRISAR